MEYSIHFHSGTNFDLKKKIEFLIKLKLWLVPQNPPNILCISNIYFQKCK